MSGYIVLFVAVIVCMASSDVNGQQNPKPCCLPKKYSAGMVDLKTANSDAPYMYVIQSDYDAWKKVVVNYTQSIVPPSGSGPVQMWYKKILMDYAKKKVYLVRGDVPDVCSVYPFTEKMTQCVPDEAEYLTSSYLGFPGSTALTFNAWRFNVPSMVSHGAAGRADLSALRVTLAMTPDCVPIVEATSGPGTLDQLYMFHRFRPNLTDHDAFSLPASCPQ